jgi:hypothetical protein
MLFVSMPLVNLSKSAVELFGGSSQRAVSAFTANEI